MADEQSIAPAPDLHDPMPGQVGATADTAVSTPNTKVSQHFGSRPKRRTRAEQMRRCCELRSYLSTQLALVETVSMALRSWEEDRELGSLCVTLTLAVEQLGQAHQDVGRLLDEICS